MSGITIWVTLVLSLTGLGIAFFYMKKVVSIPLDLGLDEVVVEVMDIAFATDKGQSVGLIFLL